MWGGTCVCSGGGERRVVLVDQARPSPDGRFVPRPSHKVHSH